MLCDFIFTDHNKPIRPELKSQKVGGIGTVVTDKELMLPILYADPVGLYQKYSETGFIDKSKVENVSAIGGVSIEIISEKSKPASCIEFNTFPLTVSPMTGNWPVIPTVLELLVRYWYI